MASGQPTSRDRLLYELAAELTSSLELDQVLGRVMSRVVELMSAARGFVVLTDPGTGELRVRISRGEPDQIAGGNFLGSRSVIEEVVSRRLPVLTLDASADERFRSQDSVVLNDLRSIIAVPLLARGEVTGAVYVDNPFRSGAFQESDKEFLQAIADLAAIAIDNARLYSQLRDNYEHAEHLRRTFELYVNKQVTDWVLNDPNRDRVFLAGQRLEVTMLATDIAGFSQLAQELEAEALVKVLNGYFARMIDIVIAHGGNIDKFLGDGMLAAFGAPVPLADSAPRALAAARDMHSAIAAMNIERRGRGEAAIQVGMGIDSGLVVAGNVGSERRLEYTLIGVAVNNATFLSKQRPAAILLSHSTYSKLGAAPGIHPRPPIVLKGASRAETVYALEPDSVTPD